MKRRIIRLGGSTLVLSLPNKWVKAQKLAAGAELDVEEDGPALRIATGGVVREERTARLSFSGEDWHERRPEKYVQRMLATAYKQGADTIIVTSTRKEILDYIERRVEGFIGVEIIDQKPDTLVIKSLVEGLDSEFESIFQRAILLTSHISKETVAAVKANDKAAMENLLRLERTHNKVTDFAKRLLARRTNASPADKYLYSFLAEDERLVDEFKHILQACKERKASAQTLGLLREADDYLQNLLTLAKKHDPASVKKLSRDYLPLRERAKALLDGKSDLVVRMHLHSLIVRTYELGETILEWRADLYAASRP